MKLNKIIIVVAFVISPFINYAQSLFDKFEDMEGVSTVVVSQKAFELMTKIGVESDDEYLNLIKNLNSLKVFATENDDIAKQMASDVSKYLKTAKLEELMRVNKDGNNVKIYVKEGNNKDYVKELFMFVKSDSDQTVIVSLTGDIDLKQISKLTEKMNIPGGEHLNKANKQK